MTLLIVISRKETTYANTKFHPRDPKSRTSIVHGFLKLKMHYARSTENLHGAWFAENGGNKETAQFWNAIFEAQDNLPKINKAECTIAKWTFASGTTCYETCRNSDPAHQKAHEESDDGLALEYEKQLVWGRLGRSGGVARAGMARQGRPGSDWWKPNIAAKRSSTFNQSDTISKEGSAPGTPAWSMDGPNAFSLGSLFDGAKSSLPSQQSQ